MVYLGRYAEYHEQAAVSATALLPESPDPALLTLLMLDPSHPNNAHLRILIIN